MKATTCTIDGFGPLPLVRPGSVNELGEIDPPSRGKEHGDLLHSAGRPTSRSAIRRRNRATQSICAAWRTSSTFPARDMTVTVQAGITIRELRDILAKENLRLPIDVAQADRATLGGILAANISGPRRYGFGTLRDYVIGISAINDEGREFKAGGRVVKNVAGYDICKLLVGSLGTLGIITQATLKLRPLAEHHAVITLGCESTQLEALLTCLHASRTRPVCIDLLNQTAARIVFTQLSEPERQARVVPDTPSLGARAPTTAEWALLVGYEGNFDAVGWQVQQLVKEVGTQCPLQAYVDAAAQPLWDALVEQSAWSGLTFKANLPPSATAAFCQAVDHGPALRAHAGNGVVLGRWRAGVTMEEAGSMLTAWRELAAKGNGSVIVPACPSEWKKSLSVWGPAPSDAWLMREVKAKFDPHAIFNPGRFVDGI